MQGLIFKVTAAMAVAAADHLLLSPGNRDQTKHVAPKESPTSVLDECKCIPTTQLPRKASVRISNRSTVANPISPQRVFYDFDDPRTRSIIWNYVCLRRKDVPLHLLIQGIILEEKKGSVQP